MATPADVASKQREALALSSQEPLISDVLKKSIQDAYDSSQDIIKPLDTATTAYLGAPNVAREKFQDVFNPFTREKLVSQYTGQEAVPMMTLSSLLGQRFGTMQDLLGAGTGAFKAQVAAKQGEADIAQKELENKIALSKASGGGGPSFSNILALFNALKPSATQETQAAQAQSGLSAVNKLTGILGDKTKANRALTYQNVPLIGRILGGKDTQIYQDSAREAYDAFLRSRTGAAMGLNEEQFYKQYIPSLTDTSEARQEKVDRLKNVFNADIELGKNPMYLLESLIPGISGGGSDWAIEQ